MATNGVAGKGRAGGERRYSDMTVFVGDLSIDEVTVTSTAAELNILDGVTATAAELNQAADTSTRFEIVTAANVIAATENNKDFVLSATTGFQTTMPLISTSAGFKCRIWGGPLEVTGSNHTIICNASDTNKFFGAVSAGGIVVLIDTHDTITLVADKFLQGDYLEFFCDGVQWHVTGVMGVTVGVSSA